MNNVERIARLERIVRLIMRARTRACDALLDLNSPALVSGSRYIVSRDRANRLHTQYAREWREMSQVAR